MSSGANDPHADIQVLVEALACTLGVIERQGLQNPEEWRGTVEAISARLDGQHEQEIIARAIEVMARNRTVH